MNKFLSTLRQVLRNMKNPIPEYLFVVAGGVGLTVTAGKVHIHLPNPGELKTKFKTDNYVISGDIFDAELEIPVHLPIAGQNIWVRNLETGEMSDPLRVNTLTTSQDVDSGMHFVSKYAQSYPVYMSDFTQIDEPKSFSQIIQSIMNEMLDNGSVKPVSYKKVQKRLKGKFSSDGLNYRMDDLVKVGLLTYDQTKDEIAAMPALVHLMIRTALVFLF